MTNLNTANIGQNKYCGPAVLSILTGKSTDECARVISRINGEYNVKGVMLADLLKAADRLGYDNIRIEPAGSLFGTITRLASQDGMYIVAVPQHFVVIEVNEKKVYFCDNHTKSPIPAAASARLLQKVAAVNKVFKRPDAIIEKIEPLIVKEEPTKYVTEQPRVASSGDNTIQVYGCYSGTKLYATFRNMLDATDYSERHNLQVKPLMDNDRKWLFMKE